MVTLKGHLGTIVVSLASIVVIATFCPIAVMAFYRGNSYKNSGLGKGWVEEV